MRKTEPRDQPARNPIRAGWPAPNLADYVRNRSFDGLHPQRFQQIEGPNIEKGSPKVPIYLGRAAWFWSRYPRIAKPTRGGLRYANPPYGLIRRWEERPLKESVDLSIAVFGQSFLSGEPQRLMQGFVNRKR